MIVGLNILLLSSPSADAYDDDYNALGRSPDAALDAPPSAPPDSDSDD